MTEPWTPGPWEFTDEGWIQAPGSDPAFVAEPVGPDVLANARLIAAAPEMAELLAECENSLPKSSDFQADVLALLSRIRGEA